MIFLLGRGRLFRSGPRPNLRKRGGGQVKTGKKASKTLKEELIQLLDEDGNRRQILQAVVDKAIGGDMKAFEAVREILNENDAGEEGVTIKLGKGIEEISR